MEKMLETVFYRMICLVATHVVIIVNTILSLVVITAFMLRLTDSIDRHLLAWKLSVTDDQVS